jgi:hypothetical protein
MRLPITALLALLPAAAIAHPGEHPVPHLVPHGTEIVLALCAAAALYAAWRRMRP